MRVQVKVLSPRMKHGKKTDRSAQTFGIGSNREQRFRCGAKQNAVNLTRILQREPAEYLRQRKHNMEIGTGTSSASLAVSHLTRAAA
jgi:hypothetical protein